MIEIYTDGCCTPTNPGPGGWATIIYLPNSSTSLSGSEPYTTNNRMEITAVLEAMKWSIQNTPAIIYSDSSYVVNGVNKWIGGWANAGWKKGARQIKNIDLWQEVYDVKQSFRGRIEWVRGHSGVPGNEEADMLAKLVAENQS